MKTVEKSRQAPSAALGGRAVLGIFAKEPVPGQVKTRLCPPFSPEQAAEFHRLALAETVAAMSGGSFALVLCHTGGGDFFRRCFPGLPLLAQGEGDLGRRMERTLRRLLAAGCRSAALIGADTPDLPRSLAENAFTALERADFVTAPAADGGYVLVGVKSPQPVLFRDIPWGSPEVLAVTRCRAAALAIAYSEIAGWDDIDDPPSLERLLARAPTSAAARFAAGVLGVDRV